MSLLPLLSFIAGFFILIKGADLAIDHASKIGTYFRISHIVMGLTVVAFGTSLPELTVNVTSVIQGNTTIALGNILGSNLANILLILGITAIISPLKVTKNTLWREIPFSLLAIVTLAFAVNDIWLEGAPNLLSRVEGIFFLGFLCIFLYYTYAIAKASKELETSDPVVKISLSISILLILIGFLGTAVGGQLVVEGAKSIASMFGVSEALIALTIVAVGTSLPELVTSTVAALKGRTDIAIGNVVGSNIFNIFGILGISSLIRPIPVTFSMNVEILLTILATIFLMISLLLSKQQIIGKKAGILFVSLYVLYVVHLVFLVK